jgi:hypothetical protein
MYFIDFKGTYGVRYAVYETDDKYKVKSTLFSPSPKQTEFFDSMTPLTLFGGARGGGKTEAIIWDAIYKAYLVPGSRSIIFRRTMGELRNTIIDRVRQLPIELVGRYIGEMSSERVELPNGSIIRFGSARSEDDVRKMLSGEFLCIYFDEWSEWPYAQWSFVTGSNRTTIDKDVFGNPVIAQIKGATNPGGRGGDALNHLFGCDVPKSAPIGEEKETYIPTDYKFIQSFADDNPAYAMNTIAGQEYRKSLLKQRRSVREAWLYGKWTGFEGQYFDCYDKEFVAIPHDTVIMALSKQFWHPIWISIDWGKVHFSYVAWHTFITLKLYDGKEKDFPVTFREYMVNNLSEIALASQIVSLTMPAEKKRLEHVYLSPETFGGDLLSRANRIGDVFVANDMIRPMAAFNKREDGWTMMYALLEDKNILDKGWNTNDTVAGWLIDDSLDKAFEALPSAMVSKKLGKDGDIDGEGDSPLLDVLDGLRYGIASYQHGNPKPYKERLREVLKSLPVGGNQRYMTHLKMDQEEKKATAVFYGGTKGIKGMYKRR